MENFAPVIGLALVVPTLLLFLFFFVSSRLVNVRDDGSPFECGFDPKSSARVPFSLRFFLLAVIFLVFDVEIGLFFPVCYSMFHGGKSVLIFLCFLFLGVVALGLFVEWGGGALDWVNDNN